MKRAGADYCITFPHPGGSASPRLGLGPASPTEIMQGLAITGHFLNRELEPVLNGRPLPEARARLLGPASARRRRVRGRGGTAGVQERAPEAHQK